MDATQDWEVAPGGPRRWPHLLLLVLAAPALVLLARGGISTPEPGIPLETPSAGPSRTPASVETPDEPHTEPSPEPLPPLPVADGAWEALGEAPVAVPVAHRAVWTGTEFLVFGFGGETAGYDPETERWHRRDDAPFDLHPGIPPVWTGTRLVVFGGGTEDGAERLTVASYEPSSGRWHQGRPGPLPALVEGVAVWTGREVVLWGTVARGQKVGAVYDPDADGWGSMPQAPVPAAELIGGVWTAREVVVYGQRYTRPGSTFAAAYDPYSRSWRRLPAPPVGNPGGTAAVWTGRDVLLWAETAQGPDGQTPQGVALRLDEEATAWRPVELPAVEDQRLVVATAGAWTGEHVALVGSLSGGDGWLYHPGSDTWRTLPPGGGRRVNPAVAWTGERLLVWGGYTPTGPTVDLVAWEPQQPRSRVVCREGTSVPPDRGAPDAAASSAPLPDGWTRSDPAPFVHVPRDWVRIPSDWTAVTAGEEHLLLFGASDSSQPWPLTGASLDLASGEWTCLPDAPVEARRDAAVAWTGEEVLVWGGQGRSDYGDGAAYHPASGSWRRLPTAPIEGVPSITAWTGTELLVLGTAGPGPGIVASGGAAYDPWSNRWRRIPAPGGLSRVSSVWTGAELLVLALGEGAGPTDPPYTAAYDPVADSWRTVAEPPLTAVAAALAETLGVVVGWDYGTSAATYDPAADAWAPLPAPPLRPSECWPASAALDDGRVFAWFCHQAALLDVRQRAWEAVDLAAEAHLPLVSSGQAVHAVSPLGEVLTFRPPGRDVP